MALSTSSLKKRIADKIHIEKSPELQRTLAVMPFLGTGMGSGERSSVSVLHCTALMFHVFIYFNFLLLIFIA